MILGLVIFFSGFFSVVFVRKHYLLSLMGLEFMMLSIYYIIFLYFSFYLSDYFFLMVFLIFSVCEGVLGLSLLVFLVRSFSLDFLSSFILC